ncbi:GNAT family N-acetyltransferase [Pseudonocardia sp.]|uniref:GNAT family N-acetyltransferase n=1 Tax=Pseudonocardia sp. TaxID=60912 RepID=UPI0026153EA4|nr:GNAT family N-acetyltransferase [Pseudonocardia sp.]
MRIRRARPDEAPALAALAVRSKGHWPYPPDLLARFARGLGMSAEVVAANEVWLGERDGRVGGFYTLVHRADRTVLDDLWLEPAEIGRGCGRVLFTHARRRAADAGTGVLEWEAEPYAVGFYERMGGVTVRWTASPLGRPLPVMRMTLP